MILMINIVNNRQILLSVKKNAMNGKVSFKKKK